MNNNQRGQQHRQNNRSRNRPTHGRSNPQRERTNQPPRLQQCNQSTPSQASSAQANSLQAQRSTASCQTQEQQQHQRSPYSKTYNNQHQSQQQHSINRSETSQYRANQDAANDEQPNMSSSTWSENQHSYSPSALDSQADALYSDVHCSLVRAVDTSYNMPISEHLFYSSYESYDNIMLEQRRQLNEMMSNLSQCSKLAPNYYAQGPQLAQDSRYLERVDYAAIDDMQDKYDSIHEFSEQMYDRIGQNLDDASGLRMRDAQLVQATLRAANQNKLTATTSQIITPAHPQHQQIMQQTNLSSSSSSSSIATRPSETNSPASFNQLQQIGEVDYQFQHPSRVNQSRSSRNDSRIVDGQYQQSNIFYPTSTQNQHQPRGYYGTYVGKQQYGSSPYQRFSARENKIISRPQDSFKDEIDNSYKPFEPLIKNKPNALVPLSLNLEQDEQGTEYYSHPYEYEIRHFEIDRETLVRREPIEPLDFNSTPVVLVETVEQLEDMCNIIEKEKELAVDVEHHSYRSYQGITCLLQISTRSQDFVIDTIKLRSELERLNRSFTNPNIVKVFHGADCDILWLQRDFGVYVVNLFDTCRAAKFMKFAHLSLAFLMKHYCNVETDKSYQLADWRERPLPLPMLDYARADTHFLLYIYDRLRNDLLDKDKSDPMVGVNLLNSVFNRCKEICLKRYEKPTFSDKSHLSVLRKSKTTFNAKQMYAFKEMYQWRDKISRKLDESVGYVLPNNLMIRIAEYLPREPQGITALYNPVPPTLKKYLSDVHAIILKAIEIPLDEASKVMSDGNPFNIDPSLRSIDLDSMSHKQDVAHAVGMQEGEVCGILDMLGQLNCDDPAASEQRTNDGRLRNHQRYGGKYNQTNYRGYMHNLNQNSSRLYNFLESTPNEKHQADIGHIHQSIQKQFVSPYSRYEARNK